MSSTLCAIISAMDGEQMNTKNAPEPKKQTFWDLLRFGLIALIIVVPIRLFIAEPFVVSGSSMFPTFQNGNYLIVDKISYRFQDPKRDDVIVFRYPNDTTKFFIKRIIGLPGETVDIAGSVVTITNSTYKDGLILKQPFVENQAENKIHAVLADDEYFVMGDNRSGSSDSRYWGPLKRDLITGKAFLRLLPVSKVDVWPGDYKQTETQ